MSNIVPLHPGGVPAIFKTAPDQGLGGAKALQEGLSSGFAVVKYKGSKWAIRHRGDTEILTQDNGAPMPFLDVVILAASPHITKTYYEKRFSEGDDASPDCFSMDGMKPDAAAPRPQSASCAACPMNVFGSRVTEAGKKAKACQDNRILVIVPEGDVENESYGGPMMLRIPPMSLANAAAYGRELARFGADLHMVKTRLGFDYSVAYPLITFQALGWLDDATGSQVIAAREPGSDSRRIIDQMLSSPDHEVGEPSALAQGGPAPSFAQEALARAAVQPPAQPAPPVQAAPVAPPAPVAAPAAPAAPAEPKRAFGRKAAATAQAAAPAQPEPLPPQVAGTVKVEAAGPEIDNMIDGLLA